MTKKSLIIGTLDTSGMEFELLINCIGGYGLQTVVVDSGVLDDLFLSRILTAGR